MKKPLFEFPSPKDYIVKPVAKHTESTFRDICTLYIPKAIEESKKAAKEFATYQGISLKDKFTIRGKYLKHEILSELIFDFCKKNFIFIDDKKGFEQIRLPNKLWADGYGDCEDFVIFCASILINLGQEFTVRMVDYQDDMGWSHIYIIYGKTILDVTDSNFNQPEQSGKYLSCKIDASNFQKYKKQGLGRIGINPEKARVEGRFSENGNFYSRQREVVNKLIIGQECDISFSLDIEVKGYYALIPAELLQPSHLGAIENPLHFIPEAQPRNRAFSASGADTPRLIAEKLRPAEICEGSTAYSGCPIINQFGEVIQGNGRAFTMKYYWENFPIDPKNYLAYLLKKQSQFGFLTEYFDLEQPKNYNANQVFFRPKQTSRLNGRTINDPILVRVVNCTDLEAIALGQYKQSDLEAVQTGTNNVKSKVNKIDTELTLLLLNSVFVNSSYQSEKSMTELIRESNLSSILIKRGIIRNDEFLENYVNQRTGQINADGVKLLTDILVGLIFKGTDPNTPEIFKNLPDRIQTALGKSAKFILDTKPEGSIKIDIANAMRGTNSYLQSKDAGYGFKAWKSQISMFGNSTPEQEYSPASLSIIELFGNAKTQTEIIEKFKTFWQLTNADKGGDDIFGSKTKVVSLSKDSALEKVFAVKNTVNNDISIKIKIRQRQGLALLLLLQI